MPEQYKPSRAYWKEVSQLDRTLYRRGEAMLRDPLDELTSTRMVLWEHDNEEYIFKSGRLLGAHLGSDITHKQDVPNNSDLSLYRFVTFTPRGPFSILTHQVLDSQYVLNLAEIGQNPPLSRIYKERLKILHDQIIQTRHQLNRPKEETYEFIIVSLKQGKEATK